MIERGLARSLIRFYIKEGFSANKTLLQLQSLGLGYRRQDFLKDFKLLKSQILAKEQAKKRKPKELPKEHMIGKGEWKAPEKYQYVVKISGYSDVTGEYKEEFITVYTDTNQDWEGVAEGVQSIFDYEYYEFQYENANFEVIEQNEKYTGD